jgi:hypothetical protein
MSTVVAREAQRMYSTTRSTLVSQYRSVVPLSAWLVSPRRRWNTSKELSPG